MSTQVINIPEVKGTDLTLSEIKQATLLAHLCQGQDYRPDNGLEDIFYMENASADPNSIVTFNRNYSDDDTNTTRDWYLVDATYAKTTSSGIPTYAFTFGRDVGLADGKYRWVRISM